MQVTVVVASKDTSASPESGVKCTNPVVPTHPDFRSPGLQDLQLEVSIRQGLRHIVV